MAASVSSAPTDRAPWGKAGRLWVHGFSIGTSEPSHSRRSVAGRLTLRLAWRPRCEQSRRALVGRGQSGSQAHRDARRRRTLSHHDTNEAPRWQLSPAAGATRDDSETRKAAAAGANLRGGVPARLVRLPSEAGIVMLWSTSGTIRPVGVKTKTDWPCPRISGSLKGTSRVASTRSASNG